MPKRDAEPDSEGEDVSLEDAATAVRTFLKVIEEAQDMKTARATGSVLDEVLRHAGELLDIVEEELEELERNKHATLIAAAPMLRQKLERLRDELRGGAAN